jgi:hypothetical protein
MRRRDEQKTYQLPQDIGKRRRSYAASHNSVRGNRHALQPLSSPGATTHDAAPLRLLGVDEWKRGTSSATRLDTAFNVSIDTGQRADPEELLIGKVYVLFCCIKWAGRGQSSRIKVVVLRAGFQCMGVRCRLSMGVSPARDPE